jgi:hypothetical protein
VSSRSRRRTLATFLVAMLACVSLLGSPPQQAQAVSLNPCDLPGVGTVCGVAGDAAGAVAGAAGDAIMRGVTSWVTNAAVWVTGKVGELIEATTSPDVQAGWFEGQYRSMLAVAGLLAVPMLLLAVIQAVWRQDIWILLRSAFGYLPMAFILAGVAIVGTQLLIAITDDLSASIVQGVGDDRSNLLASIGDAYESAVDDKSNGAIPLFGTFLGALILAVGAFILWLEMIIRSAAIYIALFFLPLTFIAMIWPATGRWARRLVEFLVAVVLAKLVIFAIIALATAALTNTTLVESGDGATFEKMIAGAALLVLAAWSPFALMRLIPIMETAAAGVTGQRAAMSGAAGSAGIQSPAGYMRQAMDRHSRGSTAPASSGPVQATYANRVRGDGDQSGGDSGGGNGTSPRRSGAGASTGGASTSAVSVGRPGARPNGGTPGGGVATRPRPAQKPEPPQPGEPSERPIHRPAPPPTPMDRPQPPRPPNDQE